MSRSRKNIPSDSSAQHKKVVVGEQHSSDKEKIHWCFDRLDTDGKFAFDLSRKDFDHHKVLEKIIAYSNMTWAEVKMQTHDQHNKSKHHFLDVSKLSPEARERFHAKRLEEYADSIFSFSLQNKLRIIGIRRLEKFFVVWYDPNHEFCPSTKK
jgi:G3E family GTPase